MKRHLVFAFIALRLLSSAFGEYTLRGRVIDAMTGEALPSRLYIQNSTGAFFHARTADTNGNAVEYARERSPSSVEIHTSLSAHPFAAELSPGDYTITAELGKEYHAATTTVSIKDSDVDVSLELRRWTNMAARGWYSGDTHVHRAVPELPTVMLAEDLNVSLPLTAWVTDSRQDPSTSNKNPMRVPPAKLIKVDPTHVIWPVNTEYEIFTVNGKTHTLGAVFVLNHKEPFTMAVPPVKPVAKEAQRQGAILELDKHNWPWSMMLMPTMNVPLFELTNNHLWRTEFRYGDWYPEYVGDYMNIKLENNRFTERQWIDFGFQNYYALLNCGFDMKPTAGTASGVHPVPLGFGRVYVKIEGEFSYEKWIDGLTAGNSFATTGPMLETTMDRQGDKVTVNGVYESGMPLGSLEVVLNGKVHETIDAQAEITASGSFRAEFRTTLSLETSSWVAVRGFEARPDKRPRFAHTAPVHFKVDGKPLPPRKAEVDYLVKRIQDELSRNQGVLEEPALAEYEEALLFFQALRQKAD